MKRSLIVMLLLAIFAGGCAKKTSTSNPDSTRPGVTDSTHSAASIKKGYFTKPTTVIMPAAADNSAPLTLAMQGGGMNATVSVYFLKGAGNQTVSIDYDAAGGGHVKVTFTSTVMGQWTSVAVPATASNVVVTTGGANYTHTESYPVAAGVNNPYGVDVSKYWDEGGANVAFVAVQDAAVTTP